MAAMGVGVEPSGPEARDQSWRCAHAQLWEMATGACVVAGASC